jgi:lactate dehydrogenase-like 2-hydroxyacid dehydrogenase
MLEDAADARTYALQQILGGLGRRAGATRLASAADPGASPIGADGLALGSSRNVGLYGHTLGIVELGEVGALVVERAGAFGMTIIYFSRTGCRQRASRRSRCMPRISGRTIG